MLPLASVWPGHFLSKLEAISQENLPPSLLQGVVLLSSAGSQKGVGWWKEEVVKFGPVSWSTVPGLGEPIIDLRLRVVTAVILLMNHMSGWGEDAIEMGIVEERLNFPRL